MTYDVTCPVPIACICLQCLQCRETYRPMSHVYSLCQPPMHPLHPRPPIIVFQQDLIHPFVIMATLPVFEINAMLHPKKWENVILSLILFFFPKLCLSVLCILSIISVISHRGGIRGIQGDCTALRALHKIVLSMKYKVELTFNDKILIINRSGVAKVFLQTALLFAILLNSLLKKTNRARKLTL